MRRLAAILLLTACVILGIIACSDNNSSSPNNEPALGTMTATVDGNSFKSIMTVANGQSSVVMIAGTQNGTSTVEMLSLAIENPTVGSNNPNITATYTSTPTNSGQMTAWVSITPTVNITKITNDEISGTFSFTGINPQNPTSSKQIKDGKFRARYVKV